MDSGTGKVCRILVHLGVSAGEEKAFSEDFKETALLNYLCAHIFIQVGFICMYFIQGGQGLDRKLGEWEGVFRDCKITG